jgi:predicted metal-dependent hydrolase
MKTAPMAPSAPEYRVIRSRRATADLIIERDGSVVVRAPRWVDDEQVAGLVAARLYWIYQSLAEWRDMNATRVLREYRNGEGFLYLGRAYRLLLVAGQPEPLVLRNGRFSLRRELVERGDLEATRTLFRDYYVARGRERLRRRVDYFAPKVDVSPASVDVRELGNRWASCSTRADLAFHWKCMMAPPTIIDYIVVHELCHLRHRDHTAAFWNEVDKVLPQYRERKEWLRRNGAGLDIG